MNDNTGRCLFHFSFKMSDVFRNSHHCTSYPRVYGKVQNQAQHLEAPSETRGGGGIYRSVAKLTQSITSADLMSLIMKGRFLSHCSEKLSWIIHGVFVLMQPNSIKLSRFIWNRNRILLFQWLSSQKFLFWLVHSMYIITYRQFS